jgi:hypothetical protein
MANRRLIYTVQEAIRRLRPEGEIEIGNMDQAALFQLVPVGEENAVSARIIWKSHGIGAVESTKQALNQLVARGLIERKKIYIAPTDKIFYFRR